MINKSIFVAAFLGASVIGSHALLANDVGDLVSRDQLEQFCASASGGEHAVEVTLPDQSTVRGTVRCDDDSSAGSSSGLPSIGSHDDRDDDSMNDDSNDDDDDDDDGGSDDRGGDRGDDGNDDD